MDMENKVNTDLIIKRKPKPLSLTGLDVPVRSAGSSDDKRPLNSSNESVKENVNVLKRPGTSANGTRVGEKCDVDEDEELKTDSELSDDEMDCEDMSGEEDDFLEDEDGEDVEEDESQVENDCAMELGEHEEGNEADGESDHSVICDEEDHPSQGKNRTVGSDSGSKEAQGSSSTSTQFEGRKLPTAEEEEEERSANLRQRMLDEMELAFSKSLPHNIQHQMPLIFWHDRKQIMSVHVQPRHAPDQFQSEEARNAPISFKICTASVQTEVRVWEIVMRPKAKMVEQVNDDGTEVERLEWEVKVNFLANLEGHQHPLNFAKYSPDGEFIVSGDVHGNLLVWRIFPREQGFAMADEPALTDEKHFFDIPENKENWKRAFVPFRHEDEVNCATFSPNSKFVCSASEENTVRLFNIENGKQVWRLPNFRRKITGMCWDPNGYYIVTMSTDQRMDIISARRGIRLRTCHHVVLPDQILEDNEVIKGMNYKLFFDQHIYAFTRQPEFTPDGELLIVPAAQLESADEAFYGVYVFGRADFDRCLPDKMYRTVRPTVMISVMPVKLALREDVDEPPFIDLPYSEQNRFRWIFAALCTESVYIFDTQHSQPIAYITDMSYDNLTSLSWSQDGKVLVVSSLEGYNSFLHFQGGEFDCKSELAIQSCERPILQKPKEEKEKKEPKSTEGEESKCVEGAAPKTPKTPRQRKKNDDQPKTPKTPKTSSNKDTESPSARLMSQFLKKSVAQQDESAPSTSAENSGDIICVGETKQDKTPGTTLNVTIDDQSSSDDEDFDVNEVSSHSGEETREFDSADEVSPCELSDSEPEPEDTAT